MITLKCEKVVVRRFSWDRTRYMYVSSGIHELIVDDRFLLIYVSESLKNLIQRQDFVKLTNNIATMVLEYVHGQVVSRFSSTIVSGLICETLPETLLESEPIECQVVGMLNAMRMQQDDQRTLSDRSREYYRLDHDIKIRLHLLRKLTGKGSMNEMDKAIFQAVSKMSEFMDWVVGKESHPHGRFTHLKAVDQLQEALKEAAACRE